MCECVEGFQENLQYSIYKTKTLYVMAERIPHKYEITLRDGRRKVKA